MNKFTLALMIAMFATTGMAGGIPLDSNATQVTAPAEPPELLVGGLSGGALAAALAALLLLGVLGGSNSTGSTSATD